MKDMDALVFEKDQVKVIILCPPYKLSDNEAIQKAIEVLQESS